MATRREFIARTTAGMVAATSIAGQGSDPEDGTRLSRRLTAKRIKPRVNAGAPMLIMGATLLDGVADRPIEGKSIWIEGGRIKAISGRGELRVPQGARVIDARGKYVMSGLLNANVHLLIDMRLENLVRYAGRYDDLVAEAAQVALKNGLTTVFDTVGMRKPLVSVRDRINAGQLSGSRVFCAGWLIGMDGPVSADMYAKSVEVASAALAERINSACVENVGRQLLWATPEQVLEEVRAYMSRGIDFLKFCSNDHFQGAFGNFLAFSPRVQSVLVEEAHRAGMIAQAHTASVEGLRIAVEAGCDLIQHANHTGPVQIPESTLDLMVKRKVGVVVFPHTQERLSWLKTNAAAQRSVAAWEVTDVNARNILRSGALLLLGNDGGVFAPDGLQDPTMGKSLGKQPDQDLFSLASGHFYWLRAMEEKGCPPMEMLRAATRNVAVAYGVDEDLGTVEPGKIADLLILDRNPLQAAENYRSIHSVIQEGVVVDRDALPLNPVLTRSPEPFA